MSYRLEKEENGEKAIVIDGWEKGTAPDPYSGMGRMFSVDLETPGEVAVGYPISQSTTSGGTLGTPIADSVRFFGYGTPGIPSGSPQSFAMLDANGRVWESTSIAGTWNFLANNESHTGATSSDGLCYWLGYLFKTRGANIDYWNGTIWVNGWQTTLTSTVKHYMYVATDNVLYITNGNYLASITAPTPTAFDPTSGGTFAFSTQKLQIPVTDMAISLAEVGSGSATRSTLLIGGQFNAIYPWDKTSSSFALPIYIADSYIKNMVSVNQNVFIFPGNTSGRGRIYITNGSQAQVYFKMPDYIFGEQDPYYEFGDAIFHRNNLIFGCFIDKNSTSGVLTFAEVFAIDFDTKAFRSISSIPANATGKANATCLIPTFNLSSKGFGYILGWDDNGSAPGIGYSGTTAGIGTATIITDLIPVGTILDKRTFKQIEFKLRIPLQTGESINIIALTDPNQNSFNVGTTSFTSSGGVISDVYAVNFQSNQWLQLEINITGNSAVSGVRLHEIRIR